MFRPLTTPDRISIPALRERAERARLWTRERDDRPGQHEVILGEDTLDALVEAVEAAQAYRRKYRYEALPRFSRLEDALARFDFGEET